ncbi:MAG: endo-1,4-beta-xylanase [Defluviitaleaceae bacterium]|nr:endo-1,4-beta-xylanase [Defluviitaleaceae bacterium]
MGNNKQAKANWDLTLPSLHKKFSKYFVFGNIISPYDFKNPETLAMLRHHYNAITAENAMKPVYITSAPGVYDFAQPDNIVGWAADNNINMVGHTFVWHGQSAPWLNRKPDGSPITRKEAKANLEAFIKTYATRYSGRMYSWDVINEVFRDDNTGFSGNWRDHLRRETENERAVGHWYLAYANGANTAHGESGADYIFDAFYFARKYDPHAKLYCNDYNEEMPTKREAIAHMVEDINNTWRNHKEYDGRLLIEGIGMQGHHNQRTNYEWVRQSVERFIKTGATLAVTELDITFGSHDNPANPLTKEQSEQQAEMYVNLFKMYMEFSDHIERITMWAKNDGQSWRSWGSPVFFNADGTAKDVFYKVIALAK